MKKKNIFALVLVFTLAFSTKGVYATHYVLGYSAVDENEIRWGGSTTYSTQWNSSISTWNALGKVNIAADTVWTYQDLTVSDVNSSTGSWAGVTGRYSNSSGSDTLKLNKYYLGDDTSAQKQNTASHELGHALGLAHSTSGNLLYSTQTSQTSLGSQDRDDYGYLWGY